MTNPFQAKRLRAQIERLMATAESGEDWAEICRLEEEMVAAELPANEYVRDDGQFGMGA